MKNAPCVVATALLAAALAGCAAPQASVGSSNAAASRSASYYCAKDRLSPAGDRLECNWQPSAEEACKFGDVSVLQRGELAADPQPAGRCNTGQWLVRVSRR